MKVWSWRQAILRAVLEAPTKHILLTLSTYMNEHGNSCFPTIDQLTADTSMSRPTVIKHIALAEQAGFIKKRVHGFKGRNWSNNEYIATYPQGVEIGQPQDDVEGGKAALPPQQEEGGSKGDLPPQPRGSQSGDVGQLTSFHGAVKEVYSNSPGNSPITHHPRARDDDDFIKIFNEELERCFGFGGMRRPRTDDGSHAADFAAQGASAAFFRAVVRDKLQILKAAELDPPTGLVYFRDIIPEELARATIIDGVSYHADQEKPVPQAVPLTLEMLGGDTPENRDWLSVLQLLRARRGEAVFRAWLAGLTIKHKNCTLLTLAAPSRFIARYVDTKYSGELKACVQRIWPEISTITIEVKT